MGHVYVYIDIYIHIYYIYICVCVTYISNISIVTVIVAYNYLGLHHWNSLDVINQFKKPSISPANHVFARPHSRSPAWKVF